MPLLSRKGLLAIAAVVDVALHADISPVSARALAKRHSLPARHLEPVLQALVRRGILKGVRGPRGGYALGCDRFGITAEDILRTVGATDDESNPVLPESRVLSEVVVPATAQAERAFAVALSRINLDELIRRAEPFKSATIA